MTFITAEGIMTLDISLCPKIAAMSANIMKNYKKGLNKKGTVRSTTRM